MKPHLEELESRNLLSVVLTNHMATTRPDPQVLHKTEVAYWLARDGQTGEHLVSVAIATDFGLHYDQHFVELPMISPSVDSGHTAVVIGPDNVGLVTWRVGPQVWQVSVDSLGSTDLPHLVLDVSTAPLPSGASFVAALPQSVLTVQIEGFENPAYVLDRAFAEPDTMLIVPVDFGEAGQWVLTKRPDEQPEWMRLDDFWAQWGAL